MCMVAHPFTFHSVYCHVMSFCFIIQEILVLDEADRLLDLGFEPV